MQSITSTERPRNSEDADPRPPVQTIVMPILDHGDAAEMVAALIRFARTIENYDEAHRNAR